MTISLEICLAAARVWSGWRGAKTVADATSGRHCNDRVLNGMIFDGPNRAIGPMRAERIEDGGGRMRRRTMTMGAPQQGHGSCAHDVALLNDAAVQIAAQIDQDLLARAHALAQSTTHCLGSVGAASTRPRAWRRRCTLGGKMGVGHGPGFAQHMQGVELEAV